MFDAVNPYVNRLLDGRQVVRMGRDGRPALWTCSTIQCISSALN
jgi:hypothetical protein